MFRWEKPTVQMMGKFQPWHEGHRELFFKSIKKTGQVIIMIREQTYSRGNAPWGFIDIKDMIEKDLSLHGYRSDYDFVVMQIPNITNITYGRDVGYKIEQEDLGSAVHNISATQIREKLFTT